MLYIGLMSGTSTDGVDAALCRISTTTSVKVLAHTALEMPPALRAELLALNTAGHDELHRAALAAQELVRLYATSCAQLLQKSGVSAQTIQAIGAHGQTVRHAPKLGYSWQLNAPALLAELTGIDVIADFRSRDLAAGGQGAPLVPLFHQAVFSSKRPRVVLNLGGIANISILRPDSPPIGFDTGPANALMDEWIYTHLGQRYDACGQWAASGQAHLGLLDRLLSENWLQQAPPKSTGRDLFNSAWLAQHLAYYPDINPATVQATLALFTARSVARAIQNHAADCTEVIVCGGGAYNSYLLELIAQEVKKPVHSSDGFGIGAQEVEAAAFAWLAYAYQHDIAASHPAVTGAMHSRLLGAWYKA